MNATDNQKPLDESQREAVLRCTDLLDAALDVCNEAWNAFDNGKRKHHTDAITGKHILGCQACAIEKLKSVLKQAGHKCAIDGCETRMSDGAPELCPKHQALENCCTPEMVQHYEKEKSWN